MAFLFCLGDLMHRILFVLLIVGSLNSALADAPIRHRAIDVVLLNDGTRLLGVVMPSPEGDAEADLYVQMLFRAAWLKKNAADLYDEILAAEEDSNEPAANAVTVQSLLKDHITQLQSVAEPDIQRVTFLTEELLAMQPLENAEQPNVVLVKIPEDRIRRQILKQPKVRQLAGLGILNQVESTETAKSTELRQTLQQIESSQLVRDLPGQQAGNAEVGLQRVLVHADRMIGKTSRLVFFNGTWLSESAAAENQQAMMMQMMTGGLQSQLQQLLNETAGPIPGSQPKQQQLPDVLPPKAQTLAASEDADVVEVRTMKLNPGNGTASVGIAVYSRGDQQSSWKKVAMVNAKANQSDVSEESRQRILQDARVKEVTDMFSQLGVNSSQLNSALTMGAVVESASGRAELLLSQQLKPIGVASAKVRVLHRKLPLAKDQG